MDQTAALHFLDYWLTGLRVDLWRYVVFAVSVWLILWVLLAIPLKGRKIRPDRPAPRQMLTEFFVSVRSIAVFSTIGMAPFILHHFGLFPQAKLAASWGPVWLVASGLAMVVGHDAWFYWTHRLIHRPKWFRAFHRRHHRSNNPSPFTAYSFDLGEAAIQAAFVPLWVILVPTPWEAVSLWMLHQIARNTIGHSGYELFPARADGRPLFGWLTTVTHHDLHHAQAGYNYGLYFTWWDRVMGTEHPRYLERFAAAVRKPGVLPAPAPEAETAPALKPAAS